MILKLARKSILNRRTATALTIVSIALSVSLFLGVERIRHGAKESFSNTISKTDLIVGARTGPIQLLLFSIFHIGNATNNVSRLSWDHFKNHSAVRWTIPFSLGDSHRGYRVVGTNQDFLKHYRYSNNQKLKLKSGSWPSKLFEVAIGARVAQRLGYQIGSKVILAHGIVAENQAIQTHSDRPFRVSAILASSGTPIDRSLYTSLEGIEALHVDWADGAAPLEDEQLSPQQVEQMDLQVKQITSFLLGTVSRLDTLMLQREINDFQDESLSAIIPGVALSQLWDGISYGENALVIVAFFVVIIGLFGMLISIYNSLNERRREMSILRSVGAGPFAIFSLLWCEAALLTFLGSILGIGLMFLFFAAIRPLVMSNFGLALPIHGLTTSEAAYLGVVQILGWAMGLIPAWRAYRNALSDGLTIRV